MTDELAHLRTDNPQVQFICIMELTKEGYEAFQKENQILTPEIVLKRFKDDLPDTAKLLAIQAALLSDTEPAKMLLNFARDVKGDLQKFALEGTNDPQ